MAEEKLIFPVGFDLDSGVDNAISEWNAAQQRLAKTISGKPIHVKIIADKDGFDEVEKSAQKAGVVAKKALNESRLAADSYKSKVKELTIAWNNLTAAQRGGVQGNAIIEQYKQLSAAANGNTSTIAAASKMQDKQASSTKNATTQIHAQNAAYNTQLGYVGRLVTRLGVYGAIFAGFRLISNIRETTAEFELQKVALGAIIQDAQKANMLFSQIKTAAVESPFEIKDLVSYTKQLAAYRIGTDELFETTMRLADVSAGLGISMDRIVLAYGQIRAKGSLMGSELKQLTEAGIPMAELLADKFTKLKGSVVSAADVMGMISDRAVSFKDVKGIFDDMTSAGGMFYQMQAKQAKTLAGEWSNLKDAISIAYDEMGRNVSGTMSGTISVTKSLIANWSVIADVVKYVGLGYAAIYVSSTIMKANQAQLNKLIGEESVLRYKNIMATAQQKIQQEQLNAIMASPNISRSKILPNVGFSTPKNDITAITKQAVATGGLTKEIAYQGIVQGQTTKIQRAAFIETNLLTKAEVAAAVARRNSVTGFNILGLSVGKVTSAFNLLKQAIKANWILLLIGAVYELATGLWKLLGLNSEYKDSLKAVNDKQTEHLQKLTAIDNAFQKSIKTMKEYLSVAKQTSEIEIGGKKAFQEARIELEKLTKELRGLNLEGILDLSDVNIDNIVQKYDQVNQILKDSARFGVMLGENVAKGLNGIEGWFGIFGENLKTDMDDMNKALGALFMKIDIQTPFGTLREQLLATYDTLTDSQKAIADTFLLKRQEYESEAEYNQRLVKSYQNLNTLLDIRAKYGNAFTNSQIKGFDLLDKAIKDANSAIKEYDKEITKVVSRMEKEFGKKVSEFTKQEQLSLMMAIRTEFADPKKALNEYAQAIGAETIGKKLQIPMSVILSYESAKPTAELTKLQKDIQSFFNLSDDEAGKIKGQADAIEFLSKRYKELTVQKKASAIPTKEAYETDIVQKRIEYEKELNNSSKINIEAAKKVEQVQQRLVELDHKRVQAIKDYNEFSTPTAQKDLSFKEVSEKADSLINSKAIIEAEISGQQQILQAANKTAQEAKKNHDAKKKQLAETYTAYDNYISQQKSNVSKATSELEQMDLFIAKLGLTLAQVLGGSTTQAEDPFIILMKNRMTFMKDFEKGYEELSKVMGKGDALLQEQGIMMQRGVSVQVDAKSLKGTKEELAKWYEDAIAEVSKKVQKMGGAGFTGLGVEQLLGKDTKNKVLKKYLELLQDLFNVKTDLDTDIIKDNLTKAMDDLASQIESQQKSSKFFEKMLGLTGDHDLAMSLTMSVYGDMGEGLAGKIKEQLTAAFKGIDISKYLKGDKIDYKGLDSLLKMQSTVDKLGTEGAKNATNLIEQGQSNLAQYIESLYSALDGFQTFEDRRNIIAAKGIAERNKMREESGLNEIELNKLIAASKAKEKVETDKVKVEEFKASDDYALVFQDIDNVATPSIERVMEKLKEFIEANKDLDPQQMKTLTEEYQKFSDEMTERNPFAAIAQGIKDYVTATEEVVTANKEVLASQIALDEATQARIDAESTNTVIGGETVAMSVEYGEALKVETAAKERNSKATKDLGTAQNKQKTANSKMIAGLEGAAGAVNKVKGFMDGLVDTLGITEDSEAGAFFSAMGKALGFVAGAISLVAVGMSIYTAATTVATAATTALMTVLWPLLAIAAAIAIAFAVFTFLSEAKVRKANKEIEKQQKLIEALEYSYGRLEKAMEDAMGTDALKNYNDQYTNLLAQAAAAEKQAAAERSKGKDEDEEKTQEYLNNARDLKDEAADLMADFSKKIFGFGMKELAQDIASIWLEAKVSGENTMDALSKKWKEMMREMVANTIMAKAIEAALDPVFKKIDELKDSPSLMDDPKWWADLSNTLGESMENSDTVLNTLYDLLQKQGINLKDNQTSLTGISKNIAQASEESILGLAAGINTQNYYISGIYNSVNEIKNLMMSGGTGGVDITSIITMQNTYLVQLPNIAQNTANTVAECKAIVIETRRMADNLDRVIKPRGVAGSHMINTQIN